MISSHPSLVPGLSGDVLKIPRMKGQNLNIAFLKSLSEKHVTLLSSVQ